MGRNGKALNYGGAAWAEQRGVSSLSSLFKIALVALTTGISGAGFVGKRRWILIMIELPGPFMRRGLVRIHQVVLKIGSGGNGVDTGNRVGLLCTIRIELGLLPREGLQKQEGNVELTESHVLMVRPILGSRQGCQLTIPAQQVVQGRRRAWSNHEASQLSVSIWPSSRNIEAAKRGLVYLGISDTPVNLDTSPRTA
jgi:hypothetical protein